MNDCETLLQQGNELFKNKKYTEAIEKYNNAIQQAKQSIKDPGQLNPFLVRAYNNRSQSQILLKQFEDAIQGCKLALELDEHEKTFYLCSKALFESKKYLDAYKVVCKALSRKCTNTEKLLQQMKTKLINNLKIIELADVLSICAEISADKIFTTKQLKDVEIKQYHDIWHVVDYFDPTKDKKFEIPCPPEKFAPHIQDKEQVLNMYYKFSQGVARTKGASNVAFVDVMLRVLKNRILFHGDKQIVDIGLKQGYPRCKTVTYYEIAKGGVVVKDYEPHVWAFVKFEDGQELNIDFLASQYDYFDRDAKTGTPLRLFGNEETTKEKYNVREAKTVTGAAAKKFIKEQYEKELELQRETISLLNSIIVSLENVFREKGLLKKGFLL